VSQPAAYFSGANIFLSAWPGAHHAVLRWGHGVIEAVPFHLVQLGFRTCRVLAIKANSERLMSPVRTRAAHQVVCSCDVVIETEI
jgi:hypothetical protein